MHRVCKRIKGLSTEHTQDQMCSTPMFLDLFLGFEAEIKDLSMKKSWEICENVSIYVILHLLHLMIFSSGAVSWAANL